MEFTGHSEFIMIQREFFSITNCSNPKRFSVPCYNEQLACLKDLLEKEKTLFFL